MNEQQANRLIDALRESNRHLAAISEQLELRQAVRQRRPYKPLILHIGGESLTQEQFYNAKTLLDEYFRELEGSSTRAIPVAQSTEPEP